MVDSQAAPNSDSNRMSLSTILNSEQARVGSAGPSMQREPSRDSTRSQTPSASSQASDGRRSARNSPGLHGRRPSSSRSGHGPGSARAHSASRRAYRVERSRRDFRPAYTKEECDFIWYWRDDLRMEWNLVKAAYDQHFADRKRIGLQGLQCKYYRHLADMNIAPIRERDRKSASPTESYGLVGRTERRYWWMRDEHRVGFLALSLGKIANLSPERSTVSPAMVGQWLSVLDLKILYGLKKGPPNFMLAQHSSTLCPEPSMAFSCRRHQGCSFSAANLFSRRKGDHSGAYCAPNW